MQAVFLISFGVIVHLIVLYSVLDIYFTSPLVQLTHSTPKYSFKPIADRVVIFVADGLRADKLFRPTAVNHARYLQYVFHFFIINLFHHCIICCSSLMQSGLASYGTSHTHVRFLLNMDQDMLHYLLDFTRMLVQLLQVV